jgi:uncharacterized membrane protein YphA (DoxX/SURF4 family)
MTRVPAPPEGFEAWLVQPLVRLELVRIFAPLAVLGFMSSRMAHAEEWLGDAGFRVPDLGGGDWRQPFYVPALPGWACWAVVGTMLVAGLAVTLGWHARRAAAIFAVALAFVALSDRLSAFTVSKIAPALMLVLALSPCGSRFGVDAWLRRARDPKWKLPTLTTGGVRFFQAFVPVMYSASGIAKLRGDWLSDRYVLWTHVHDSYQTVVSWMLANALPAPSWTLLQGGTLVLEVGAPLWFLLPRTRPFAFCAGVTMHALIGLMFGPVKWFALLMIALLVGAYLPERALVRVSALLERLEAWRLPGRADAAVPRSHRS